MLPKGCPTTGIVAPRGRRLSCIGVDHRVRRLTPPETDADPIDPVERARAAPAKRGRTGRAVCSQAPYPRGVPQRTDQQHRRATIHPGASHNATSRRIALPPDRWSSTTLVELRPKIAHDKSARAAGWIRSSSASPAKMRGLRSAPPHLRRGTDRPARRRPVSWRA
jgi:hypothetical protein